MFLLQITNWTSQLDILQIMLIKHQLVFIHFCSVRNQLSDPDICPQSAKHDVNIVWFSFMHIYIPLLLLISIYFSMI